MPKKPHLMVPRGVAVFAEEPKLQVTRDCLASQLEACDRNGVLAVRLPESWALDLAIFELPCRRQKTNLSFWRVTFQWFGKKRRLPLSRKSPAALKSVAFRNYWVLDVVRAFMLGRVFMKKTYGWRQDMWRPKICLNVRWGFSCAVLLFSWSTVVMISRVRGLLLTNIVWLLWKFFVPWKTNCRISNSVSPFTVSGCSTVVVFFIFRDVLLLH